MLDLAVSSRFLTISNETYSVAVDFSSDPCIGHEFIRPRDLVRNVECGSEKCTPDTNDGNTPIVSSNFSKCGKLFVCCCQKYLTAWKVDDWKLIGKKTIQRSANKVIFTPSNDIIVADKSGDVYLHLLKDFATPGTLLLGHLSMLLDVIMTPDEKYIITCDRDEKIKVSLFPKSYVIESYCLGHEEFVTYIHLLPHDSSVLVSSGGDGTVRLWHYHSGKELLNHSLLEDVADLDQYDASQVISYQGIVSQIDSESSFLCLSVFKINAIILYTLKSIGSDVSCNISQILKINHNPICFRFCEQRKLLWILVQNKDEPLMGFELVSNNYVKSSSSFMCKVQETVQNYSALLKNIDLHERFINSLAKKRFDNEGEYYKRKQERIERKKVKKIAT